VTIQQGDTVTMAQVLAHLHPKPKRAAATRRGPAASNMATALLAMLDALQLPAPRTEYQFHPRRRWRMDYAWPDLRLFLEVEGGVWVAGRHTRGSGYIKDLEKYNTAAAMGWRLIRCQPRDLQPRKGRAPAVLALLRECLPHAIP